MEMVCTVVVGAIDVVRLFMLPIGICLFIYGWSGRDGIGAGLAARFRRPHRGRTV